MRFDRFTILKKEEFGSLYKIDLGCTVDNAPEVKPCQFLMLNIPDSEFTLGRPFAIFDYKNKGSNIELSVLIKVKGKGTAEIAKKEKGDFLDVTWPLGKCHEIDYENYIIVAGGYGIAGVKVLVEELINKSKKIKVLYGGKIKEDLSVSKLFKKVDLIKATEDGSAGYKGLVTDLLKEEIGDLDKGVCISCGPDNMMKEVYKITSAANIPSYFLMEERMGCGFGVCLGCAIHTADGKYKLVCKDGPMFKGEEIFRGCEG